MKFPDWSSDGNIDEKRHRYLLLTFSDFSSMNSLPLSGGGGGILLFVFILTMHGMKVVSMSFDLDKRFEISWNAWRTEDKSELLTRTGYWSACCCGNVLLSSSLLSVAWLLLFERRPRRFCTWTCGTMMFAPVTNFIHFNVAAPLPTINLRWFGGISSSAAIEMVLFGARAFVFSLFCLPPRLPLLPPSWPCWCADR